MRHIVRQIRFWPVCFMLQFKFRLKYFVVFLVVSAVASAAFFCIYRNTASGIVPAVDDGVRSEAMTDTGVLIPKERIMDKITDHRICPSHTVPSVAVRGKGWKIFSSGSFCVHFEYPDTWEVVERTDQIRITVEKPETARDSSDSSVIIEEPKKLEIVARNKWWSEENRISDGLYSRDTGAHFLIIKEYAALRGDWVYDYRSYAPETQVKTREAIEASLILESVTVW